MHRIEESNGALHIVLPIIAEMLRGVLRWLCVPPEFHIVLLIITCVSRSRVLTTQTRHLSSEEEHTSVSQHAVFVDGTCLPMYRTT